ncbi:hypothetical protein RGU73_13805 [Neobacillus cucumis]|nr:hypothetical protein [Neobacillus cucumis]MDR4947445.1 hypothetical protein [Neobacillus cucumis]
MSLLTVENLSHTYGDSTLFKDVSFRGSASVRAALARCGLKNEHISRPLSQLSGGEQAKFRLWKLHLLGLSIDMDKIIRYYICLSLSCFI